MAMGQMQLLAGGGRKERAALYEDAKQVGILRRMMESIPEFSYRFLPSNGDDGVPDDYACDEFRIYEFKVRRCSRGRSHDWTDCPYAHPGEKARRRDPRKYNYSGTVCPEFRKGSCRRGDSCEFSHGVFESWLHPTKYRTMACKDGRSCRRKICFFAHTPQQLRVLPPCANSGAGYCPTCSAAKAVAAAAAVHHHHHVPIGGCSPNTPLGVGSMIGYTSPSLSPPSPHSSMAYQAMLNELMTAVDRIDLNSTNVVNPGNCRFSPATPVNNHHHHRSHPTFYSPVPMWKLQEEEEADAITRADLSSRVAGAAEGGGDYNVWGPEFDWVKDLVQI